MEGMEVMEEASLSRVSLVSICFKECVLTHWHFLYQISVLNICHVTTLSGLNSFRVIPKCASISFPYLRAYSWPVCQIVGASSSSLQGRRWAIRRQQELLWQEWQPNLYLCESMHLIHEWHVIYEHFCHVSTINLLPNLAFNVFFSTLKVPLGTVVKEQGKTIVDLSQHGQEYMAVFGGAGGKGNQFFLSNENRAPMTATPGMQGQERVLQLELRTMAHAGLVRKKLLMFENNIRILNLNTTNVMNCFFIIFIPSGGVS